MPRTVHFPINFRRAGEYKNQLKTMPSFGEMTWEDNKPRQGISVDGFGLVSYVPRVVRLKGTVSI